MLHGIEIRPKPIDLIGTARARRRLAVEKMRLRETVRELRRERSANLPASPGPDFEPEPAA